MKFFIQRLTGWEFRNLQFIKGLLCRSMNCDFLTDFPARTFPAAWSFPAIRRFGSCVLPAVWKKRQSFWLHCLIRNFWKFAKNRRKKAANLFRISCSVCRCVSGGYLVVKVWDKLTRCVWNNKLEVVYFFFSFFKK